MKLLCSGEIVEELPTDIQNNLNSPLLIKGPWNYFINLLFGCVENQ